MGSQSISRFYVYTLVLHSALFMGALMNIRSRMTADNESDFEISGNEVSFIIAVAAVVAVEVTTGIMFWTSIMSNCYAVLQFIGIVSANVASCSIMKVMDNTQEHFPVMYLLGIIFFFVAMALHFSGDDKSDRTLDKTSFISILAFTGLFLEPISLVLVLFVPKNVNWIVVSVVHPTMVMEALLFLAIFVKFVMETTFVVCYLATYNMGLIVFSGIEKASQMSKQLYH